jgi:hypothetical protein
VTSCTPQTKLKLDIWIILSLSNKTLCTSQALPISPYQRLLKDNNMDMDIT